MTRESLSDNVKKAEYAVRGKIPLRGEEVQKQIDKGSKEFPFDKTTSLNIGNPQAVGQGFLSFNREVSKGRCSILLGNISIAFARPP